VFGKLERHEEAVDTLRHAIALAKKTGALADQAVATRLLGWVFGKLERHEEAVDTLRHAIALAQKAGALADQAVATRLLGWVFGNLGRHEEAVDTLHHAITLAEQTSNNADIARSAVILLDAALKVEDDATLIMAWQRAVSAAARAPAKDKLPDVSLWFDDVIVAALRSGKFGEVWLTTAHLATKDERHLLRAQEKIAEAIAEASLKQGRAAAYALAADWVDVLSRDAAARVSREGPAGLEPVAFLRGSIPGLAQRVSDPALLRDIAALLEQRLPSETKAERALLEAAARRAENPDDPAALERMDPDVVKALERVLGIVPQPESKPAPRRIKRSSTSRRKK
jgi:tetratricopeptide (TPR) repeat protein